MLTDSTCKNATCPAERKHLRLTDSDGLFLEITPNGSKRWFWKYTFGDKSRSMPVGQYAAPGSKTVVMTLKQARAAAARARAARQDGVDPIQKRKADKLAAELKGAVTFEAVAREFYALKVKSWSPGHASRWLSGMERDLFSHVGGLPVADVSAPLLLQALRRVEQRGALDTVGTLRQNASQVFSFAIAHGKCASSPTAHLKGLLQAAVVKNMSAVLTPVAAGALLRAIDGYSGHPVTRAGLALSALLFQRPGNLREMEWAELNLDAALWTIPSLKMKRVISAKINGRPHLVPLAPQAVAILRGLQPLTGHGKFVFPSLLTGERCMSENTLRGALRRLGYSNDEMTPHGFRAMARTLMVEHLPGIEPDWIEAQLAHGKAGPLGFAYDRAQYLAQRTEMMTRWANYLDALRVGAKVIHMQVAA